MGGSHHHPAVDDQDLPRNVAGQVGGEKEDGGRDVGALAQPSQRNVVLKVLLGFFGNTLRQLGLDIAGRNGIYQHVAGGQLLGDRFGEADHPGLGRGVVGLPLVAVQAHHAGDVDDPAPAALDHPPRRVLGHQKRPFQVRVDDRIPVGLGH